jgi:glycosyltransferase involved in cell wall biosynthesis
MQSQPTVSVIIPTYNRARVLCRSAESVLAQTYRDFELIIVDDGSTDNTEEVVRSYSDPRIRFIRHEKNRGVSVARNIGIKAARGEFIAFNDSDDIWLPQNLELKVKLLDSHPDTALVCSDYYIFDGHTGANLCRFWDNRQYRYLLEFDEGTQQPIIGKLARVTLLSPLAIIMRRRVFDDVGYFDESLHCAEDWDMWFRILQRFSIRFINLPLARYRKHDAQLSTDFHEIFLAKVTVLKKLFHSHSISKDDVKFIKKKLVSTHMEYGWNVITRGEINLGRQKLLTAIRINPWCIRTYIYLAVSILGSRGALIVKSCKKRLDELLTQRQASGTSQSSDIIRKT